jgi:hypothetical protein
MQDFRVSVNDKDEIVNITPITAKFSDSFNIDKGYRLRRTLMGSCQYNCIDFPSEISFSDIGKVTVLARKYLMVGNALGYKKNNRIYLFKSVEEIGKAVGISSKTQCYGFMKRMFDFAIIRKVDNGFYVNPVFFIKNGEWLTFDLFAIFYMEVRVLIPASLYRQMFEACMDKGLLNEEDYQRAKDLMK